MADLTVERGEFVGLLGPSGCGKTTLLRLIAGFEEPDAGEITIGSTLVAGRGAWVPPDRRHVAMVFQDYALFPHLTVAGNVGYGLPRRERPQRIPEVLKLVGLAEHSSRYPHELSGGQQQRVALARALAPEPAVILLDEPWSNIDPLLRSSMRDELAAILRAIAVTVLLVTHEREEAFSIADRIALMHAGTIVQAGAPEQIYYSPATRWAAEFVGAANFLPGRMRDGRVETPLGLFPVLNANGARGLSGNPRDAGARENGALTRTQGASICRHIGATEDAVGDPVGGGVAGEKRSPRFAAAAGAQGLSGQAPTSVDALVRPELLELELDPQGPGEVVSREFRGHDVFYRVRLDDGTVLCSQRPSTELVPLGARVALRPHESGVTVFP